jgi:hypothetical protein
VIRRVSPQVAPCFAGAEKKMKTMAVPNRLRFNKVSFAIIALLLILVGIFIYSKASVLFPSPVQSNAIVISQAVLEDKYGLRVNLVGVTAAGGMVDVRLKMLDGEKARLLLLDKQNFPTLLAGEKRVVLSADPEIQSQEIKFENDGGLFLLFPNSGNVVKPGSPVSIKFGDIQLEAVAAR